MAPRNSKNQKINLEMKENVIIKLEEQGKRNVLVDPELGLGESMTKKVIINSVEDLVKQK